MASWPRPFYLHPFTTSSCPLSWLIFWVPLPSLATTSLSPLTIPSSHRLQSSISSLLSFNLSLHLYPRPLILLFSPLPSSVQMVYSISTEYYIFFLLCLWRIIDLWLILHFLFDGCWCLVFFSLQHQLYNRLMNMISQLYQKKLRAARGLNGGTGAPPMPRPTSIPIP